MQKLWGVNCEKAGWYLSQTNEPHSPRKETERMSQLWDMVPLSESASKSHKSRSAHDKEYKLALCEAAVKMKSDSQKQDACGSRDSMISCLSPRRGHTTSR
jgi:hypothetical protein